MRILAITNHFPLPQDMGGALRILGMTRALSSAHDVHVLALRRRDTSDALTVELAGRVGARVESFAPRGPELPGARDAIDRWRLAVRRGAPPWVSSQFHPGLCRRAIEIAPSAQVIVLLDDYAGIYVPWLAKHAPVVADKHQVAGWSSTGGGGVANLAWRVASRREPVSRSDAIDAVHRALARHLVRRFEQRVADAAVATVVTSAEEARRFQALYGSRPDAVPNAVEFPAAAARSPGSRRIGWLGTIAYGPNVQGLARFVEAGWDALGASGCELLIAGGSPTPAVRHLQIHPGVKVLGYVEDLGEFTSQLDAGVVPLWDGAPGAKLKTLTLMAAGVPLACTPVAVEALGAVHGRDCLVAEDPAGLGSALRAIVDDAGLGARLAASGRGLVRDGFTWPAVGPRFVGVVERAAAASS